MAKRVSELEHGFGGLLAPEPKAAAIAMHGDKERWGVPLTRGKTPQVRGNAI